MIKKKRAAAGRAAIERDGENALRIGADGGLELPVSEVMGGAMDEFIARALTGQRKARRTGRQ